MSRPRVRRVAAVLRRVADRLDPPRPPAPPGEVKLLSRQELRERQMELMRMVDSLFWLSRAAGRSGDGLMWLSRDELEMVIYFLQHEIETRDRDLEGFEQDPTTVFAMGGSDRSNRKMEGEHEPT